MKILKLAVLGLLISAGSLLSVELPATARLREDEATLARCMRYGFRESNLYPNEILRSCIETLMHQPPRQSVDDCINEVTRLLRPNIREEVIQVCNPLINEQIRNQNRLNNGGRSYVSSETPDRLEKQRDLLVIEGRQVVTWQDEGEKEIDLRGKYTPWFLTLSRSDNSKSTSFTHITISFSSICCGIDRETEQKLLSFIKQEYPQIKFTKTNWGEEGEVNYTFSVKLLSPEAREYFIIDVRKIVDQGKFVNLSIGDTVNQK